MNDSDALLEHAERARRRELERASRILHDDVGQSLTAAGLELDLLALEHPQLAEPIGSLRARLEAAFQSVRRLSYDLSPDLVLRIGLADALEGLARRAGGQFTGDRGHSLSPAQAASLYRLAECAVGAAPGPAASAVTLRLFAGPPVSLEIAGAAAPGDSAGPASGPELLLLDRLARLHGFEISMHPLSLGGTMIVISATSELHSNAV
jgi:glucose-6-phosphate-specific signal transduction histidine kinase